MEIRPESENDYLKVEELLRNSFWNMYRLEAYEHFIVHNLRDNERFIKNLAYIIEDDGKIIGDINYSMGEICYENDVEPNQSDVDEFDRQFEFRKKLIKECQLGV